jgi:Tol biopolymer transport system component
LVTRIGTYSGSPGNFRIDLVNPDGSANQPLIQTAVDAGDPDWSPTGQTVAVVWTRESGETRHVSLSWADPYGNSYHQLDTDYVDIQNLHWSPDGSILTFIGVSYPDYTFSIDMVEIVSGSHKVLTANLSNVIYPRYEDQGVFYTVRWRSTDGQQGFDGFDRDGSQLFHIIIDGDVARASELFLSPDKSMAAIKIRRNDSEELQIAQLDGSVPVTVRSSLSGLGDPLWSPDGQFVGFTYSVNKGPVMFVITNSEGQEIWSPQPPMDGTYYPINAYGSPLEWVACK